MSKVIKSKLNVLVILAEKVADHLHRVVAGIPTLKKSQITAQLFLGGQYNLKGLKKLKKMGITAIVNMRTSSIYNEAHFEGFRYLHLPTIDNTPPTLQDLITGASYVEHEIKNKGKVYIHCRQGLGRGPSMAIAYLLKIGTSYEDSYNLIKSVRSFINPRPGQIVRLKELEQYYKKEMVEVG